MKTKTSPPTKVVTLKKFRQAVERRVIKDTGLPLSTNIDKWNNLLQEELFSVGENMTVGEFKESILIRVQKGKNPSTGED